MEGEKFLFEGGPGVLDSAAKVTCFGAEEEIEDELDAVDLELGLAMDFGEEVYSYDC
jgi:hypothetical protein